MARVKMEPAQRRAAIVAAARKLVMERGVSATPVCDIVKEAGVAQGTFYWYFASKEEVLQAVAEDLVEEVMQVIEKIAASPRLSAIRKFRKLDKTFIDMSEGYSPDLVDYFHENFDPQFRMKLEREALKKMKPLYAQIIRQGVEEGLWKCDTPDETASIMIWAWEGVDAEVRSGDPKVRARAVKAATDFIYRGLGYEKPSRNKNV